MRLNGLAMLWDKPHEDVVVLLALTLLLPFAVTAQSGIDNRGTKKAYAVKASEILVAAENGGALTAIPMVNKTYADDHSDSVVSSVPMVISVSPSSGLGLAQTFTAVYADTNGTDDLTAVRILFNTSLSGINACYVSYQPGTNGLYLANDTDKSTAGPITPGSSSSLSNSQCTLSGTDTSVSTSGNNLTVNYALTFSNTFAGLQNIYLAANDPSTTNSTWSVEGTWTPNSLTHISPRGGSGLTQTFSAVYYDPAGLTDLTAVRILFNTSVSGVNACYVSYEPGTNGLYLADDGDDSVVGPITPGSPSSLSNSQCTLSGTGTSVSASGNNLTVNYALAFSSIFGGLKNVYLATSTLAYPANRWAQEGSWTPFSRTLGASLSPSQGSGLTQKFTAVYSDPNGIDDLTAVRILFNTSVSGISGCYVSYEPGTSGLYLADDGDGSVLGPITPGSSSSLSNSQCTLSGTGTSVSTSGNNLTVNYALTFSITFTGLKNVYLDANNLGTQGNTWVQEGTWTPSPLDSPTGAGVTPSSGSGLTQTFAAVYSDPNGGDELTAVRILFNTGVFGYNACYVSYEPDTNGLYLANDTDKSTDGPITPGSSSSLSNSQCTLSGTGTSVSTSGNNLTVNYALTFSNTFTGSKNVYLDANNPSTPGNIWAQEGTWMPSPLDSPTGAGVSPESGSGLTQTFTAVYSDPNGADDLTAVRILFNTRVFGYNACYVSYEPGTNGLYLANDADNSAAGPITPGSPSSLSNSQCTLSGTGTSVSTSGNYLTVNYALTFSSTFTGLKNVYQAADTLLYPANMWVQEGSWTP